MTNEDIIEMVRHESNWFTFLFIIGFVGILIFNGIVMDSILDNQKEQIKILHKIERLHDDKR